MRGLLDRAIAQACPLCRAPLPPDPNKLCILSQRVYVKVKLASAFRVDLNDGVLKSELINIQIEQRAHYDGDFEGMDVLSPSLRKEMDGVLSMLNEAAYGQGHVEAMCQLAHLYDYGHGCPRNLGRAKDLYHMAETSGHPHAKARYAELVQQGRRASPASGTNNASSRAAASSRTASASRAGSRQHPSRATSNVNASNGSDSDSSAPPALQSGSDSDSDTSSEDHSSHPTTRPPVIRTYEAPATLDGRRFDARRNAANRNNKKATTRKIRRR
eukprot:FR743040.1.p1 GENE.FR743040.1~~FR743040.1.p1  ORF type:complete len:272 (+),score=13.38 FR743040.1:1-816(+)